MLPQLFWVDSMGVREALYVIAHLSVSVSVAAIIVLLLGGVTKWRFPGLAILLGSIGVNLPQ
jgi:hypothetical protein